jgi:CHAT domain
VVVAQYYVEATEILLFGMAPDWPRPRMTRIAVDMAALATITRSVFRTSGGVRMMMQDNTDGGLPEWHRLAPLVAPLAEWTAPGDVVYLVPHRELHDLPLHTLPPDAAAPRLPLAHRNPVCYAPSLAVLLHTLGGRPGRSPAPPSSATPAAPCGGRWPRRSRCRTCWACRRSWARLTRAAVLAALRDVGVVHLATHTGAAVDDGLAAGVELADGDVLRAADLLRAPIGADVVVLSGCETGVSEHRPGDEAVGLVRALLHGGARALLTSQRRINDQSAQHLITAFHERSATQPRAVALQEAMRSTAAETGSAHFYHWGGFVLVGDWR